MKSKILYTLILLLFSITAISQEMRLVSGIINDREGEPMIGVTVKEKGTSNGTVTDLDGYYEMEVPLGSVLQFSFIGMKSYEMKVTASNSKPAEGRTTNNKSQIVDPTVKKIMNEEKKVVKKEIKPSREDQSLSPYFLIKSKSPQEAQMPLRKTDVAVNIAGVIADVSVKQIYINESKNTLEAVYVFPGSTRAAVYAMAMTIGDRRIEAKIKKKEQARQEYEQAKSEGKSTTLLEQHRPNVFQMNVANILPGDTIIVEMRYTELLEHENSIYEFVYPTVVGPRYSEAGEQWVDTSIDQLKKGRIPEFNIKTIVQAGMPIQKISSITHSVVIESPSPDEAIISLANPKDNEGNRDYILQYELQGGKVESGLLRYEHGDENFFLLMVQPPKSPTLDQIPPREYVFIIDVSGSMYGFPLEVSKKLIRNLISGLRPIDRFNVMLFESSNAMLYNESIAATEENIQNALNVIDKQRGSGGTRLYPAIEKAMNFKETEGFSRTFIIVTDGFVTVEKEAFNYVRAHLNEANLFPFGIGSNVNRYIIEGLAHAGMGTPYIITNKTQAEEIGQRAIKEISQPVLTNIDIDWGDFDVYDVEPVAIPDVFAQRPILVYGKYKNQAKGTISVSGLSGNSTYEQKFDVSKAKQENNQALRYLWARNQIRYYDDYAQYYEGSVNGWSDMYGNHQRSSKQIEYVTNLGLKYNLLTQYTSFLAVDQEVRVPKSSNYNQDRISKSSGSSSKSSTPQSVSAPSFELEEDNSSLEEVIVVGYGVQKKQTLTGSVQTVSNNNLSTMHTLQGRVAGLQISETSGEPGTASRIRIRGASSIMDNNSPLVILDGVPVSFDDLKQMDSNNLESISIIKDASATSIYGSKASNGVVVITSKKPAYKRESINFKSSFSVETPNKLPKLQRQFTQGRPENGTAIWYKENEAFSWGPSVESVNAPTYDAYDIFDIGYTFKNHLALSKTIKKHLIGFRLGNNTQQGFIPNSKFNETSIGLRMSGDLNYKLNYDIDLSYKHTFGRRLQRGYNMSSIMQGILLTPSTFDSQHPTLSDGSQNKAGDAVDNPYWTLDNNPFKDKSDRFIGNLNLTYKPIDHLSFKYQLNGDLLFNEAKTALNIGSTYNPLGQAMNRDEDFKSLQSRFMINFDKNWDDINFSSTLGYEYSISKRTIDRLDGYELSAAGNYDIQKAKEIIPYSQLFKRHSNALFGKVKAEYRNMLALETSMRGEWSSISDKTLLSPSAVFAMNLAELFPSSWYSLLRLYASASWTDKETPLFLDPVYFNSAIYNLNDASQHFESREIILDKLKPEKLRQYEVGTNLGFFNNRLTISASLYWKRGKDQLLPIQISPFAVQLENCGSFRAHGFEVELGATPIHNRDFSWNTSVTFSRERNKAIDLRGRKVMLAGIEDVAGSYAIEGQPLGVLYGTAYKRNDKGQMIIGADGFPIVSEEPQVLGNPNPDWQLGWSNTLSYRKFSFAFLLDYKKGGKMWNGTKNVMNYYGTSKYSAAHRNTKDYIFSGVLANGQVNNIPINFEGDNLPDNRWIRYGQYGVGEDAIEDASYLKLREVSLGYSIPVRAFDRRTNLKLSVFATNVLLYSKYKGVDPETNLTGASNGFGLDYFNIPGVTSIGLSLNWEF